MPAQVGRGAETGERRDAVHGLVTGLKQLLGASHALPQQPLQRGCPERAGETASQGPRAHVGSVREILEGERLVKPLQRPFLQVGEPVPAAIRRDWRLDVLRLAAIAVRWDHQPAGKGVCHCAPVVPAD